MSAFFHLFYSRYIKICNQMKNILLILLSVLLLADVYLIAQGDDRSMRVFTKPFLLPLLLLFYVNDNQSINQTFCAGLVFSFLGDVFLLFNWGFLPGLGSFLTAHVLYVFCFKRMTKKQYYILLLPLILFLISLIGFLYPYLGEMKIPVIFYAIVISVMFYFAATTQNRWLIIGAIFFVISDSILSINIFYESSIIREMLVMITYIAAQYFLVTGMKQFSVLK